MAPEIVGITEAELPELHRVCCVAFGEDTNDEMVDDERLVCEYDRMLGVSDDGRLVGSAGAYSFRLTVPGLGSVGAAGVTWVAVLPTHRRRGILRAIMQHQLDDIAEREEPVALLTASEATIYSRFGYGVGAQHVKASVRTKRAAFIDDIDDPGSIRLAWSGDNEAVATMAEIYDEWRRARPGALSRHDGWWGVVRNDHAHHRRGLGKSLYVIHEDADGAPDGYATYNVKLGEGDGANTVVVDEVVALDSVADGALWRFLLDIDLTTQLVANALALDDPLKWRLADPRALTAEYVEDWLWVRVLDAPAALEARSYAAAGRLVIEVVDPFRPDGRASGTFALDADPTGASCEHAHGREPDLTIPVDALGTIWLGAARPSTLADAGRIAAIDADTLALADALFAVNPLPFCNHGF
jgi:predicted acetyltransferase